MFDEIYRGYRERIEAYLQTRFLFDAPQRELFDAMRYSLLAGGKRLRPVLTQAFCALCGENAEKSLQFAAAVEMIHTYSLIHDDLPCMDNDDFRRGKPTNHRVFGEAKAVLAGDALQPAAFFELTEAPLSAAQIAKAVRVLARCAGERGMVGGQILDIDAENRLCTEREVLDIQSRKTGALFEAACVLGVIAANGDEAAQNAAAAYAASMGLAFQIQDDILDVTGDEKKLGKPVGTDEKKNTFVRLYGVDTCRARVREESERAIEALRAYPNAQFLTDLVCRLQTRDF